jgi:hypothetical protein
MNIHILYGKCRFMSTANLGVFSVYEQKKNMELFDYLSK